MANTRRKQLHGREVANTYNCVYHPIKTSEAQPPFEEMIANSLANLKKKKQPRDKDSS